jgi:hypothetical protein
VGHSGQTPAIMTFFTQQRHDRRRNFWLAS